MHSTSCSLVLIVACHDVALTRFSLQLQDADRFTTIPCIFNSYYKYISSHLINLR
ncbi:hypothetical protein M758_10G176200 [Ceratodon purpureus]|nr:hypothetical protein M758_10G176200 [Ceratodon purpureus]